MASVFGQDLKVGDVIEVWWKPAGDLILDIKPYRGTLEYLFPTGASIAYFAPRNRAVTDKPFPMTIGHSELFIKV